MHARRLCQAMTLVVVALLLLAGAVAPSPARAAFGLEVGQEVRNAIDVRALRKIPLPPGRWKVDASFEEKQGLNQVGRLEMPIHNLVLSNGDRQADIPVLVLRFTDLARASWTGQPCDTPHASPALSSNTFGSTASSLNIRCNRVFAFDHFRRSVGQGNMSPNAWLSKRFATLSSRSAELPVHTLVGHAYMSAHRGDWLEAWAYANPAPHGLEAAPDGGPFFRSPDRLGDRAEVARRYTRTFAEWFDGYTTAVYQQYLEGNAAGFTDAFAHAMREFEVMAVARRQIRPRLGDHDDRLARLQFLALQSPVHVALEVERGHVGVVRIVEPLARTQFGRISVGCCHDGLLRPGHCPSLRNHEAYPERHGTSPAHRAASSTGDKLSDNAHRVSRTASRATRASSPASSTRPR